MNDFQVMPSILKVVCPVTYLRGTYIHTVFGLSQDKVLMKIMHTLGILEDLTEHTLILSLEQITPVRLTDRDGFRDGGDYRTIAGYQNVDSYADYGFHRISRHRSREFEVLDNDKFDYRCCTFCHNSREKSCEINHDFDCYSQDSDYERGNRDGSWQKHDARDYERERKGQSHEKERSPRGRWGDSRSLSRDRDDRSHTRSRERSSGRSRREDSYDDCLYDKSEKRRDHDDKHADSSFTPSATVVVKGLSPKITEEDLDQILAEWGPLEHVCVIRERNSGASCGIAFVDFPNLVLI